MIDIRDQGEKKTPRRQPFIGVYFKCCRHYVRAYLNRQGNAYIAWCPRCAAKMVVKVSPYGSDSAFFEAF